MTATNKLRKNRLKQNYQQGKASYGTYISLQTPLMAEVAASVGLDFVRIDTYKYHYNPETIDNMVRTISGYDATPWVRCPLDAREIGLALDAGAQVVSAKVSSVADTEAFVAAVRYPPAGDKESSRPKRYHDVPDGEYLKWAEDEILISLGMESPGAWKNYKDIVKVKGVDIIQFGKHGVAQTLGIPIELSGYGEQVDPRMLEAEKAMVQAIQDAGKQVCIMDSMTPWGLERLMKWVEKGVLVIGIDSDTGVLYRNYGAALKKVRGQEAVR